MRHVSIFIMLVLAFASLSAQERRMTFASLPSESLPTDEVSSLYQDSDGFIWILTYNGLVRYDGYQTKIYSENSEDESHTDSNMHRMIEDENGHLIIGSDRGLLLFDKSKEMLSCLHDPLLDNTNINNLIKDRKGRIWVCCDKGLFFRDKGDNSFSKLGLKSDHRDGDLTDLIDILADPQGNIWLTSWHNGLHRYNLRSGRLYSFNSGALNESYVLHMDGSGNLWIGTWGAGLLKIDADDLYSENPRFEHYTHDSSSSALLDDIIYEIEENNRGEILVGGRSGLSVMHGDRFENYYPDNTPNGLPFNEVNAILCTKDNIIWLGMFGGGVCKVTNAHFQASLISLAPLRDEYKTNSVKSIYRIDSANYLLGIAGHGFFHYDTSCDSYINYLDLPAFKGQSSTGIVNAFLKRNRSAEICLASYDRGLWLYNPSVCSAKIFSAANSALGSDCVRSLDQDTLGNVFLGTRRGVFVLDVNDSIQSIYSWIGLENRPQDDVVVGLDQDADGTIWVATEYGGIISINKKRRIVKSYAIYSDREVKSFFCILVDSAGNIWAGSRWNGLFLYDRGTDRFKRLDELVFIGDRGIRNIAEGPDGRIWATTANQVISFDFSNGYFERIWYQNISDRGESLSFNYNVSLYSPADSSLALGTSHGILFFSSVLNSVDSVDTKIALTDFQVNGKSVNGINSLEQITLKHDQNDIDIRFSLLDFNEPGGDIYRYRLVRQGRSAADWMIVNGDDNVASFRGLGHGRYKFEVSGARSGCFMSGNTKILDIFIKSNPWKSWWAVLLYAFVGFAAITIIIHGVVTRIRFKRQMEFEQMNAQKAEEINQAKLRFFTNVSHEFLTPISIIMASIEGLELKSEANRRIANIMSVNMIRLTRLVLQVLEFRKVESDNLKLQVSCNDAAEFVGHSVEAFQPLVRKRNLTITFESDPLKIEGWYDPDKLDKIIYNLISNAVKYTPEGGSVKVMTQAPNPGTLVVKCINSGEPMDDKTRSRLFRRFYEGDYRKFNTIGTGIGLSLVKSLVEKHKGKIEVDSFKDIGNCFTVTIPINKDNYAKSEIDSMSHPNIPLAFSMGASIMKDAHTVLLVDDNEDLLATSAAIMSKRFTIKTCANPEKALQILDSEEVDVVVADVMMPGMNGYDFCARIKSQVQTSHIPVILLTARKDDNSRIEGYAHGADGYLTRPCNFSVLSAMIGNLIKKQESKSADFRKQLVFEVKDIDYTSMDKKFLQQAIDVVNEHIADSDFNQTNFVNAMNVSRTVLTEKLKSLTGFTPAAFMLNTRLTVAYKLVMEQNNGIRVSELAYSVGFSDAKYFSKKFKEKYGKSPKEMMDLKNEL